VRTFLIRPRSTAVAVFATVATIGAATASIVAAPAAGAPATRATSQAAARADVQPGRDGATKTLAHNVSFAGNQRTYDMATDKAGLTYIAWLSSEDGNNGGLRHIHLCVIPRNSTACAGGIKDLDPSGDANAAGLRMLVTPSGQVTILWISETSSVSSISYATATKTGPLSGETKMSAPAPASGNLLDAELGPKGSVWTVAAADATKGPLQLREGLTAAPKNVALPGSYTFGVTSASLAFSGSTPIIVVAKGGGGVTDPVEYSYAQGSSWAAFKKVPASSAYGVNVGLVHTPSGVRMISGLVKNFYNDGVAKWTGTGFTTARQLAGGFNISGHDVSTDGSGRFIDAGEDLDKVVVLNLADTVHAASFSFGVGNETLAGGDPAATTSARGRGWVAWSYQGGNSTNGDTLVIAPFVLAGLHAKKTAHGGAGSVTVVGPASCLPPVSLSVSVTGHPKKGWKVIKRVLTLGRKKAGASLNGASLTAGKTYSLTGTVTFGKGGAHKKIKATVRFRSCPN
jgi:hypothetical protein